MGADAKAPPGPDPERFRHLPPPIRLDDVIAVVDTCPTQTEGHDYLREMQWMLRTAGAL